MGVYEDLQIASYGGVQFWINSEKEEAGKKTVTHSFPGSNKIEIEELSVTPSVFTFDAFLKGEDVVQQRINLLNVLNKTGLQELVHPYYGTLLVKAIAYPISSEQKKIGIVKFSITFARSEESETVEPTATTPEEVSFAAADARELIDNTFEDITESSFDLKNNNIFSAAIDKLTAVLDTINDSVSDATDLILDSVNTLTRTIADTKNKIFSSVTSAAAMKASLQSAYSAMLSIASTPDLLLDAWRNVLDFNLNEAGNFSVVGPRTTAIEIREETIKVASDEHTRLTGLIGAYESSAFTDFNTLDELEAVKDFLDSKYNSYITEAIPAAIQNDVNSLVLNNEVRNILSTLRNTARIVLDEKRQNVWKVTVIKTQAISMALLAYRFYGDLALYDSLSLLNADKKISGATENVSIFTR